MWYVLAIVGYLAVASAVGRLAFIKVGTRAQVRNAERTKENVSLYNRYVKKYGKAFEEEYTGVRQGEFHIRNAVKSYARKREELISLDDVKSSAAFYAAFWPIAILPFIFIYLFKTPTFSEMVPIDEKSEMQREIDEQKRLNDERARTIELLIQQNDLLAKRADILQDKDLDALTN